MDKEPNLFLKTRNILKNCGFLEKMGQITSNAKTDFLKIQRNTTPVRTRY